jgi:hypothetical protein
MKIKWYRIITRASSYKWCLFAVFMIPFTWGAVNTLSGRSAKWQGIIFTLMLVLWGAIWLKGRADYLWHIRNGEEMI